MNADIEKRIASLVSQGDLEELAKVARACNGVFQMLAEDKRILTKQLLDERASHAKTKERWADTEYELYQWWKKYKLVANPKLTPSAAKVWKHIQNLESVPTQLSIQFDLSMSPKTVSNAMKEFDALGLVPMRRRRAKAARKKRVTKRK